MSQSIGGLRSNLEHYGWACWRRRWTGNAWVWVIHNVNDYGDGSHTRNTALN